MAQYSNGLHSNGHSTATTDIVIAYIFVVKIALAYKVVAYIIMEYIAITWRAIAYSYGPRSNELHHYGLYSYDPI